MPTTILLVDDSQQILDILAAFLKKDGFDVLNAQGAAQAAEMLQHHTPDLILLDVVMPGMDGFEFCRHLKQNPNTRDIPVIFLSAILDQASKVKGFEVGGVDYIIKPFQGDELLARISTQLANRRIQQQLREDRAFFEALAEASFEGIVIHDGERIVEVNQTLMRLFGHQRAWLIGRSLFELILPEDRALAHQKILCEADAATTELRGQREDGAAFWIEIQTKNTLWQGAFLTVTAIRDITSRRALEHENRTLKTSLQERFKFGEMIGKSRAMQEVYEFLARAAAADNSVVIYGESGTGKELAARTIHHLSDRSNKPFVPVNCGAIPDHLFESLFFGHRKGSFTGAERDAIGFFEQAQGGTLFLDEVGEFTLFMQAKLLRVLNDNIYTPIGASSSRRADVRIIAATNRELLAMMRDGLVREDFFHRIHVLIIKLPPLREHREDIPLLVDHFLEQPREQKTYPQFPAQILEQFYHYDWPGNVRELHNEVIRYLTTGRLEFVGNRAAAPPMDAPPFLSAGLPLDEATRAFEQFYIAQCLRRNGNHRGKTAEELGVDRKTLYKKLKRNGEI